MWFNEEDEEWKSSTKAEKAEDYCRIYLEEFEKTKGFTEVWIVLGEPSRIYYTDLRRSNDKKSRAFQAGARKQSNVLEILGSPSLLLAPPGYLHCGRLAPPDSAELGDVLIWHN